MSTSETVSSSMGVCPCGRGVLTHHLTTQDNPWSTADHAYTIDCEKCRVEYRYDHGHLVRRASEVAYENCREQERHRYEAVQAIAERLIETYFAGFGAKNKKAEHTEIVRLNLSANSYRGYLSDRRAGRSLASICFGLRNTEWLRSQAAGRGIEQDFCIALAALNAAKKATEDAYRRIERIKV